MPRVAVAFDIREQICRDVGGFLHGDVLELPSGERASCVGVRYLESCKPALFVFPLEVGGALFDERWKDAKVVDKMKLRPTKYRVGMPQVEFKRLPSHIEL